MTPTGGRVERMCPFGTCDGTGWIVNDENVARSCECRARRVANNRARGIDSVIPAKYRGVSFDRPPVTDMDRTVVSVVSKYVNGLSSYFAEGRGLWLMGDVGTGKTTLAMLISRLALEAGHTVAIYSLPRLLARIRRTYDAEAGEQSYLEFFDRLTSVDLLHLDDVGAEKRTDWVLEQLYAVVNERYETGRSILVTSNLNQMELEEQIGARTVSRLVEMCGQEFMLPMYGDDKRMTADAS
ncbi:MAG: ATP-binding protein [Solirubrobacterales bacterium]